MHQILSFFHLTALSLFLTLINCQIILDNLPQVAEVTSSTKTRLSVNGWFHGPPATRPLPYKEPLLPMLPPLPLDVSSYLSLILTTVDDDVTDNDKSVSSSVFQRGNSACTLCTIVVWASNVCVLKCDLIVYLGNDLVLQFPHPSSSISNSFVYFTSVCITRYYIHVHSLECSLSGSILCTLMLVFRVKFSSSLRRSHRLNCQTFYWLVDTMCGDLLSWESMVSIRNGCTVSDCDGWWCTGTSFKHC